MPLLLVSFCCFNTVFAVSKCQSDFLPYEGYAQHGTCDVHLSVTCVYCVKTPELINQAVSPRDSRLRMPNMEHISLVDPLIRGVK